MARASAANICSRFSGTIRGISAIRLTMLSLCAACAVMAYELQLGSLTHLWARLAPLWDKLPQPMTPGLLLEGFLWLLVYLSFLARYNCLSRLSAIGRTRRYRLLPVVLSFVPVILFILPLRLVMVNLLGSQNAQVLLQIIAQVKDWWSVMTTRVVLLATVVCVVLLYVLVCLSVHVALTRMIINRQVLGKVHPVKSLRQGFRCCLAPAANFLQHAFWLIASALLMVEFAYLAWMQYDISLLYAALAALLLGGYWLAGFGPGFWGEYHVTFICLIRRLTDEEYTGLNG